MRKITCHTTMRVAGEFFSKNQLAAGAAGIAAGAGDVILRLVSNSLLLVYNLLDCKRHTDNSCCNSDDDSDDFDLCFLALSMVSPPVKFLTIMIIRQTSEKVKPYRKKLINK